MSRTVWSAIVGLLLLAGGVAGEVPDAFAARFVIAAMERLEHRVVYDGRYHSIDYPGGDVPDNVGVCTDLVVRAYRGIGSICNSSCTRTCARLLPTIPVTGA